MYSFDHLALNWAKILLVGYGYPFPAFAFVTIFILKANCLGVVFGIGVPCAKCAASASMAIKLLFW